VRSGQFQSALIRTRRDDVFVGEQPNVPRNLGGRSIGIQLAIASALASHRRPTKSARIACWTQHRFVT